MADKKIHRGTIYFTDGTQARVRPENGKKFDYRELQAAVDGYIETIIHRPGIGISQLYANDGGLIHNLAPNPFTSEIVNMKVYALNGYPASWKVSGNMVAVRPELAIAGEMLPTIAEAMRARQSDVNARARARA